MKVRPHNMVLGTRTSDIGKVKLDTLGNWVYIPINATGTRRVPLVVSLTTDPVERWSPLIDQYGMIFFALAGPEDWDDKGIEYISDLLQRVLSKYAIDPDKIAVVGMSNGAWFASDIACHNLDIFNRLGMMSAVPGQLHSCADTTRPLAERTQMFFDSGIGEPGDVIGDVFRIASEARHEGHPFHIALDIRLHESRKQDYGNLFQWLADSWASPKTTAHLPPLANNNAVVPLTTDAITKMTAFWTSFRASHPELNSAVHGLEMARDIWPAVNAKAITIVGGAEVTTVYDMMDLRAFAAQDASVTVALEKAGLTIPEEEGYWAALVGARATMAAKYHNSTLVVLPIVEQNVKFSREHKIEVDTLLDLMEIHRCEMIRNDNTCGTE